MRSKRSGYVQIYVSEILAEVSDDDLLDEVATRKLTVKTEEDLVREAFDELRRGRAAEALSILDRLLNPKWSSRNDCQASYVKAQSRIF